jgi:selenocysteine-specific elongation factor
VALNLSGVEHGAGRGDAVVRPASGGPGAARRHAGGAAQPRPRGLRRGAYLAYLGSGEHPARIRVLTDDHSGPGAEGAVRLHLATAVPLLPGDRYVLRESGRDETVGGGEVLDVAPVLPASRARPDRSVERVVDKRGWVDADELEVLTGQRRPPDLRRWVAAPGAVAALVEAVAGQVAAAGPLGLDLAALDERARLALALAPGIVVDGGRARPATAGDALADHPFLASLEAAGATPPPPDGVDRAALRELVRRGLVVETDGFFFAPSAVEAAARAAAAGRRPGRVHRRVVPGPRRGDPQARPAAAGRARPAGRHPAPGRLRIAGRACRNRLTARLWARGCDGAQPAASGRGRHQARRLLVWDG